MMMAMCRGNRSAGMSWKPFIELDYRSARMQLIGARRSSEVPMAKKRTWKEKLHDSKDFPKVCQAAAKKFGVTGTFVIPAPLEVDALMRKVRPRKLTTINEIRQCL